MIKGRSQVMFVDVADIDWIEGAVFTCLHVGIQKHIMRRSLSDLERDLTGAVQQTRAANLLKGSPRGAD